VLRLREVAGEGVADEARGAGEEDFLHMLHYSTSRKADSALFTQPLKDRVAYSLHLLG